LSSLETTLFAVPGSMVVRLDADGRICAVTAAAAGLLGCAPPALEGRSLAELAVEGWEAPAGVASARVRFGATDRFELMLRGREGRPTLVEMRPNPVAKGAAAGVATVELAWSERRSSAHGPAQATGGSGSDPAGLAYGLLNLHEAERVRLATALHDNVAPLVALVKYTVEDAQRRLVDGVPQESERLLDDAAGQLRVVLMNLWRLCTDLRPKLLDDLGLVPTLEWYCRGLADAERAVVIEHRLQVDERDIAETLKLDIFRIVQEALSNVIAHARARHAHVSLLRAGDELRLTVEDDGIGFDPARLTERGADGMNLGLHTIRKRVDATGGRLVFESGNARGTCIGAVWRLAGAPAAAASPPAALPA
jgi:two-component system NarL family sensor kinase